MDGRDANARNGKIKKKPCIIFFTVVIAVILLISLLIIFLVVLKEYQTMHKIITLCVVLGENEKTNTTSSEDDSDTPEPINAKKYIDAVSEKNLSRQYSYFDVENSNSLDGLAESINKDYVGKAVGYGYADIFLMDKKLTNTNEKINICKSINNSNSTIGNYRTNFAHVCAKEIKPEFCNLIDFIDCNGSSDILTVAQKNYEKAISMKGQYFTEQQQNSDDYGSKVPEVILIQLPEDPKLFDRIFPSLLYFYQYVGDCVNEKNVTVDYLDTWGDENCETNYCKRQDEGYGEICIGKEDIVEDI